MRRLLITVLFLFALTITNSQTLKSPEEFLGYKVGTDYKIADYETIQKYFKHLSENSDNIVYKEIGKTTLGRNMFMAVLSSAENIKNLEKYRNIVETLSDPRKIDDNAARKLADEGKVVVLVTCNIHSTEIGSAQMSMELAYKLITGTAPQKSNEALNNIIFILMPSINPDGTTMVVDWYKKYLNTEYDGSSMPYLYHYYAGHDNNRDWFMFNLVETRNVINVAYKEWFPQIWLDEHQMGATGARLFVMPYKDPINPNINPLVWRWQKVIGGLSTLHLEQQGFKGVIDNALFDGWWEGAVHSGMWHNQIFLLSEMASVNIASPIYIDPSEVKATNELTTYDIRTNYPNPWRGGWWRLSDIVDYELALTYSLIETAAEYKKDLLYDYYMMGKDAIEKGKTEKPFAYIIPRGQNDPVTTTKMIDILQMGAVDINFSEKEFKIDNVTYPANSYIVFLAQPNGRYVKDLFEEQDYPDLRRSRTESPIRPYDVAGWTVPYMMDVKFFTIDNPFELETKLLDGPNYQEGSVENASGKYFIAPSGLNVNSTLINKLQKQNIPVYWTTEKVIVDSKEFKEGSVVIPANEKNQNVLSKAAKELHMKIYSVDDIESSKLKELKKVRLGIYNSYSASMDEGWTRLALENYGFEFKRLENKDFKNKNIKDVIDVLIINDMSPAVIKSGKYEGERARYNRPKPPEYEGGIEKEGVENLKTFIEKDGGYLITIGNACDFAIDDLGVRVTNILKNVKSNDFYCPGSLLRMSVDNSQPLGYGFENEVIGYQSTSTAFSTTVPFGEFDRSIAVRYPAKNILKSGFLAGEDYLYQRGAVVDVKQKKGHVILLGFRVQNRHQTFGTFKLLFNAIHMAGLN